MKKILEEIENEIPLECSYEEDARYHWPKRWNELKKRLKADQHETLVIGLQDRIKMLAAKKKQVEGKPDGEPGGGEAFWDGKLRECQTIMNLIAKKAL